MRDIEKLGHALQQNTTNLVACWVIQRLDGKILRFTDNVTNIIFEDELYITHAGFKTSDIYENSMLHIDHIKIEGMIENELITANDLLLGRYDRAIVENFLVNYEDLSLGKVFLKRGYISNIHIIGNDKFMVEINGFLQVAEQHLNCRYSSNCRANFGDNKCKMDLTKFYYHGSITKVIDQKTFLDKNCSKISSYFDHGMILFDCDIKTNIKLHINNLFELSMPSKFELQIGDRFIAMAGCNKTMDMCSNRFNNIINFRGEPHIPGYEKIYKI